MSIQYVKGVGPKRKNRLNKLNIYTIEDLLYFIPRDYDDRTSFKDINSCIEGEKVSLKVQISGYPSKSKTRNNLSILKIPIKDDSGQGSLVWFNQNYIANKLSMGDVISVNGRIIW